MYTIMYDNKSGLFYVGSGETNVASYDGFYTELREEAEKVVFAENDLELPRTSKVCVCKECGKYFFISPAEANWYLKKDLEVPKRCSSCRKMRKEYRKEHGNNISNK